MIDKEFTIHATNITKDGKTKHEYVGNRASISAGLCCIFEQLIKNNVLKPQDILYCFKLVLEKLTKEKEN